MADGIAFRSASGRRTNARGEDASRPRTPGEPSWAELRRRTSGRPSASTTASSAGACPRPSSPSSLRLPPGAQGRQAGRRHDAADAGGPAPCLDDLLRGRRRRRDRRFRRRGRRTVDRRADGRRRPGPDGGLRRPDGRGLRGLAGGLVRGRRPGRRAWRTGLERARHPRRRGRQARFTPKSSAGASRTKSSSWAHTRRSALGEAPSAACSTSPSGSRRRYPPTGTSTSRSRTPTPPSRRRRSGGGEVTAGPIEIPSRPHRSRSTTPRRLLRDHPAGSARSQADDLARR